MNEEVDRLRAKKKQIYEDLKELIDREWMLKEKTHERNRTERT